MGARSYERLSIEVFGRHLITTNDLDPIYVAMNSMRWEDDAHRNRWLVGYWCTYHAGTASYLSELSGQEFWRGLLTVAENNIGPEKLGVCELERWPRGKERRHWRGAQAKASWRDLMEKYPERPEEMVEFIAHGGCVPPITPFKTIAERAKMHRAFGPWIAFKIGDMIDRLGIQPVDFANADVFMFKDPVQAAEMLFRQRQGLPDTAVVKTDKIIPIIVRYLESEFSDLEAPPLGDRPIGLQEVETVLCKWKSHQRGHYPLFNDILEIREGLTPWVETVETAGRFLDAMPRADHA